MRCGHLWACVLAAVYIAGCDGADDDTPGTSEETTSGTTRTPPEGTRYEAGYFRAEGTPDPLACETADDCVANTLPAEDGCCNDPTMPKAYAKAYRDWVRGWRAENCEEVECPPPPNPSRPPDCTFELRCVEGRCDNTCDY